MGVVWMENMFASILGLITDGTLTGAGPLDGAKVGLYTNEITLNKDLVYADLEQPTFTGYAASTAVVWGDSYVTQDDRVLLTGDAKKFECTGGTPSDTVRGYFLYTGTAPNEVLLMAEEFENPVFISEVSNGVTVVPVVTMPDTGDYGEAAVVA